MVIPPQYAHVQIHYKAPTTTRIAVVSFGVYAGAKDAQAVGVEIKTVLQQSTGLKACLDSSCAIVRYIVQLGQEGSDPLVEDEPISVSGSKTMAALPSNVALLVHKRSTLGGRKGRGRMFLPWALNETKVDTAGMIDPTELTSLKGNIDAFLTSLSTQSVPMRLLHSPDKNGDLAVPTVVTDLVIDPMVSTQRRRLGR